MSGGGESRRVVITGMGAVTPLGLDVASTWDAMKAGRSGIGPITLFDPARVASRIGGEIRGFEAEAVMPRKEVRRNDRYVHYAWAAAAEALADAGLPKAERTRLHERFADWLDQHSAERAELEDIAAYHLEQAALAARELETPEPALESRAAEALATSATRAAWR